MDEKRGNLGRSALTIEALVAAGPRKSLEEVRSGAWDMCEDAAGTLRLGDFCVFWICDGTSNSFALPGRVNESPGFSSRVLASDLGHGFGRLCANALVKGEDPKLHLPKRLFGQIANEWQGRLGKYLADAEGKGRLTKLLDRLPEMGDGSCRLKWSSTLLGGIYNERSRTLDVLTIGDCGAVVAGETTYKVSPKDTCAIILGTITPGKELAPEVTAAEVEAEWQHFEQVTCFIAMSDGMSKDLNLFQSALEDSLSGTEAIADLRSRLIASGALTYDDRSLVIGQLVAQEGIGGSESNAKGWLANALLSVRRAVKG